MSRRACWRCSSLWREAYAQFTQRPDSDDQRCRHHEPAGVCGAHRHGSILGLDAKRWVRERAWHLPDRRTRDGFTHAWHTGGYALPSWNRVRRVPASAIGAQVVAWARAMADALYVNPACGGRISSPVCYDTWYKAPGSDYPPGAPIFPQAVIQYGQQVCPGCSAWANGTYQCVSFVRGAYSQVSPMTLSANAFDLWAHYARQPGWMEIPAAAAPAGQRGIPLPGDVMVFKDASIGHVAIVMSVALPTATTKGAITFSNA